MRKSNGHAYSYNRAIDLTTTRFRAGSKPSELVRVKVALWRFPANPSARHGLLDVIHQFQKQLLGGLALFATSVIPLDDILETFNSIVNEKVAFLGAWQEYVEAVGMCAGEDVFSKLSTYPL